MFLHLCVILFTGGGGSAQLPPDADPYGVGQTPPRCRPPGVGQTPRCRPLGLGRPPKMQTPWGWADPPPMQTPLGWADPPIQTPPSDTVNKRAVRILLECIHVVKIHLHWAKENAKATFFADINKPLVCLQETNFNTNFHEIFYLMCVEECGGKK